MFIILNGPLGIGKSTLAEALSEAIEQCVMLDGDYLVAANPPFREELQHLHSTLALLVNHHRGFGYRHFVISHLWTSAAELDDLRRLLSEIDADAEVHTFLLALPAAENLRRIARRAETSPVLDFETDRRTFEEESEMLAGTAGTGLGDPFDVSEPPPALARRMLDRLGLS